MRSFLNLIGTLLMVYFLAPWLAVAILHWLPVEHSDRLHIGDAATIGVYSFLRRRYGDRVPPVWQEVGSRVDK